MSGNYDEMTGTIIRQRMTPTFYHHNIFSYQQDNPSNVRITPTFQSTVFDIDGYQIQTNHSRTLKHKQQLKEAQPCVYKNESRQRKQAFLYPFSDYASVEVARTSRTNDQKERLADDINQLGGRTSRLRKCVQMMSNPIFGGYSWTPFIAQTTQVKHDTTYNPNDYKYERPTNNKQTINQKILAHPEQNLNNKTQQAKSNQQKLKQQPTSKRKQQSKSITKNIKPNEKHKNTLKRFKSAANLAQKHTK